MNKENIKKHSKTTIASYSIGIFALEFMKFYSIYFFFYETEVLLYVGLLALANIIFALWNAVNDPLVGYITDKTFRFTKKWGKRFPWVMISGIPIFIMIILLFAPPDVDPVNNTLVLFFWLLLILCIIDTLISIWHVNVLGLYPDKFRSDEERRTSSAYMTIMGQLGTITYSIIPPLLYSFGDKGSYVFMASVCAVIGIISLLLMIPGVREDEEMIERYFRIEQETERQSFMDIMKTSIKQKNFVVYIIAYLLFQSAAALLTLSIPYFVKYVLGMEASVQALISLGLLVGLIGSVPLWTFIAKRIGFGKVFTISAFLMGLAALPFLFADSLFSMILFIIIIGIPTGGFWVMLMPVFSDVIDEVVIDTKKRQEGLYMGIRTFIARFSIIIQTMTFAIIHLLTGFIENAPIGTDTQPESAIWGLKIQFAIFPAIFMILCGVVLYFFYDITETKKKITQEQLNKLKL